MILPDQGQYWADKAQDWTETADAMASAATRFNDILCDQAGLGPGMRVLDLASGPGEPALTAAARVAPKGMVVASDIVLAMLMTARQRALAQLAPIACVAADMALPPFAPACFDAAISRFGLMFVPDPVGALRRIRTVLRPNAPIAVMAWGPRQDTTLLRILGDAVATALGKPPADPALDAVFAQGDAGVLAGLFHRAGFIDPAERTHRFTPLLPIDKPFWRPQLRMTFGHLLRDMSEPARMALDQDIRARVSDFREDGDAGPGYRLQVTVVTCVARATK